MSKNKSLIMFMVLLMLTLIVFTPHDLRGPPSENIMPEPSALFPSSLQFVYEDAFYGTAFKTAFFEDGLTYIGPRAFWNSRFFVGVYIPGSTIYVGSDAFPLHTAIHGVEKSFAETWAKENGYRFIADDVWGDRAFTSTVHVEQFLILFFFFVPSEDENRLRYWKRIVVFVRSMRPQDRPELYPINYRFP